MQQLFYVKFSSTNQNENLLLLDDPGRVRSQITSGVLQIQRFDFDCNLVLTRKLIIRRPPALRLKPLQYYECTEPLKSDRVHRDSYRQLEVVEAVHSPPKGEKTISAVKAAIPASGCCLATGRTSKTINSYEFWKNFFAHEPLGWPRICKWAQQFDWKSLSES